MNPPEGQVIGVKEFIAILNETLEFAYPLVTVEGEVSSFKVNQGKWVFFDLKDDEATLPCFMPLYQLKVPLEDGMQVRASGTPKLTKWGKFSLTVKRVEPAGEGALRRAYELLKAKLESEGLFETARKRALPLVPQRLGLITSAQSAAYADFIKILGSRWGGLSIQLADVQVQGAPAPLQIVNAIQYFNQLATPVDVLVIIRGGGSLEDLAAFNDETVARSIAASRTPTIVGVGHEVDVSLADLAADRRAATPTDAARLVVPDRAEMSRRVSALQDRLGQGVDHKLAEASSSLGRYVHITERFLQVPLARINQLAAVLRRDLDYFQAGLSRYQERTAQQMEQLSIGITVQSIEPPMVRIAQMADSLKRGIVYFQGRLTRHKDQVQWVTKSLPIQIQRSVDVQGRGVHELSRVLAGASPKANLKRGYAIARKDGHIIRSRQLLSPRDLLVIELGDGSVDTRVEEL
jgi:exodeoxyribonuclease VII large subunit